MKPLQRLLLPAIFCWMALGTNANNLTITGLSVAQTGSTGGTVTFTVGWNNCWNLGTVAAPNNWDAVWLFVKFRNCNASPAVPFTHGTLTYSGSTIPSVYQAMTSLPQASYYSANGSTVISGSLDDPNGIMLVPTTSGTQSSVSGTVTLAVSNLPSNASTVTVEVVGIEMVYVPQGPFYLGDGSTNGSYCHFCASTTGVSSALIAAANETSTSSYYYVNGTGSTGSAYASSVPAAWPKGYYSFYCMKYEITEDLYTQFLNTIGSSNAATHWIANSGSNRNAASQVNSYTFANSRPYRAQNWLSWSDWEAVLDWACLRPMTELEFEKACRGGSSTVGNGAEQNEYPWQNTSIVPATTFSGTENGTETFTNAGANCVVANYSNYTNGDGGQGPVRAGIFATSTSTQQSSGATYYGIMEMGGDLREFVVQMNATATADTFTRVVGDGILATVNGPGNLSVIGDANAATWPAPEGAAGTNGIGTQCYGQRGGDWYSGSNDYGASSYDPVQTSSRYNCYVSTLGQYNYAYYFGQGRGPINGGRGVR
jgi:formylglycine-generating enzyme required for sulfatase activity